MRAKLLSVVIALASPGWMISSAGAAEPAILKAWLDGEALLANGSRPVYESLTVSGQTTTVHRITLSPGNGDGGAAGGTIEQVAIENARTPPGGAIVADRIVARGIKLHFSDIPGQAEFIVTIPVLTLSGAFFKPAGKDAKPVDRLFGNRLGARVTKMPSAVIAFNYRGISKIISIVNYQELWSARPESYSGTQRISIEKLRISENLFSFASAPANPYRAVALQKRTLGLLVSLTLSVRDSKIDFTINATVREAGSGMVTFNATIREFPVVYLTSLFLDGEAKSALGRKLLWDSKLAAFTLEIANGKLVRQLVTPLAGSYGIPAKLLPALAATKVQLFLARLQNLKFTNRAAGAVRSFLAGPGKIKIAAMIKEPVSFGTLKGLWVSDPDKFLKALGLRVSADK